MRIEHLIIDPAGATTVWDDNGDHGQRELAARGEAIAFALLRSGVSCGERVGLLARNGASFITGLTGILAAGAVAVLIDPDMPVVQVIRRAQLAKVRRICRSTAAAGEAAQDDLRRADFEVTNIDEVAPAPRGAVLRPGLADSEAAICLFTSGTTSEPKIIVLSHRAVLHNVDAIAEYLALSRDDRFHVAKTMTHSSTLVGEVLVAFRTGAGLVAHEPAVPFSKMVQSVKSHGATVLCLNPSLLRFFARGRVDKEALNTLHTIHVSGSVVDREVFRTVRQALPWVRLINGYGLSEAGPRVSQWTSAEKVKAGCVGKPIRGVVVEVRRDDGTPCGTDEIGEVHVSTPSRLDGYLVDGVLSPAPLDRGFLATGDLGYVDSDGDLFVTGRKDDMIVTGGHNVNPAHVETIVAAVDGVEDCVAFGVADALLGERVVCAYVARGADGLADRELQQSIRASCRQSLSSFEVPKNLVAWSELPRGSGGKKSRRLAAEHFLGEGAR